VRCARGPGRARDGRRAKDTGARRVASGADDDADEDDADEDKRVRESGASARARPSASFASASMAVVAEGAGTCRSLEFTGTNNDANGATRTRGGARRTAPRATPRARARRLEDSNARAVDPPRARSARRAANPRHVCGFSRHRNGSVRPTRSSRGWTACSIWHVRAQLPTPAQPPARFRRTPRASRILARAQGSRHPTPRPPRAVANPVDGAPRVYFRASPTRPWHMSQHGSDAAERAPPSRDGEDEGCA